MLILTLFYLRICYSLWDGHSVSDRLRLEWQCTSMKSVGLSISTRAVSPKSFVSYIMSVQVWMLATFAWLLTHTTLVSRCRKSVQHLLVNGFQICIFLSFSLPFVIVNFTCRLIKITELPPDEHLPYITSSLLDRPVPDLVSLSNLGPTFKTIVNAHYTMRFVDGLRPFILSEHVDSFIACMIEHSVYISGSRGLLFFDPKLMLSDDSVFRKKLSDLDLYVPKSKAQAVCNHLVSIHGYELLDSTITTSNQAMFDYYLANYGTRTGIFDVKFLKKGDKIIDLVVSVNENPIFPILHFHNTCVMNALHPTGFYSFYSTLTSQHRGFVNSFALKKPFEVTNYGSRELTTRSQTGVAKYQQRGYTIKELPDFDHSGHPEMCLNGSCRLIRYTNDPCTLHVEFLTPYNTILGLPKFPTIRWSLGGYPCGVLSDGDIYQPPFVEEV